MNDDTAPYNGTPTAHDAVAAMLALAGLDVRVFQPARQFGGNHEYVIEIGRHYRPSRVAEVIDTFGIFKRLWYSPARESFFVSFEVAYE